MNDIIAEKTRNSINLNRELLHDELPPVEEVTPATESKVERASYEPIVFEDCWQMKIDLLRPLSLRRTQNSKQRLIPAVL
jgi:hypothetical protein